MLPRIARRADQLVWRALGLLLQGNALGALAAWHAALEAGPGPRFVAVAGPVMALAEGRGARSRERPSSAPLEPKSHAWALLWAGDVGAVRRLASEHPDDPSSLGLLGVASLLERQPAEALVLLDRALAREDDAELLLHRVRALLHLGRRTEARDALAVMGDGETLGRRLLVALYQAATFAHDAERVIASETHLNGLFSTTLPAIVGRAAMDGVRGSPEALTRLIESLLDRMAGNLGLSPTVADVSPTGTRSFVRLAVPPTSREASADALRALRYIGVDGVLSELEALLERHPRSVHARCYRGELHLWLGRYDDALVDFEAARAIEPARWADIGKIAALTLMGRLVDAESLTDTTEKEFPPVVGGTLPVYRGLLYRRMGRVDEAIESLEAALAAKPSRVGARMELCLALRTAGRRTDAIEHAGRVLREVAPVLASVADARAVAWWREPALLLEDAILEGALVAMRGNRSSSQVTWVDQDGELRMLEPLGALEDQARKALLDLTAYVESLGAAGSL